MKSKKADLSYFWYNFKWISHKNIKRLSQNDFINHDVIASYLLYLTPLAQPTHRSPNKQCYLKLAQ